MDTYYATNQEDCVNIETTGNGVTSPITSKLPGHAIKENCTFSCSNDSEDELV